MNFEALALEEAGADEAAEVLAADVLAAEDELLEELLLLLPQADRASTAVASPTAAKTVCVRRKTLTSPEADVRIEAKAAIRLSGLR